MNSRTVSRVAAAIASAAVTLVLLLGAVALSDPALDANPMALAKTPDDAALNRPRPQRGGHARRV